MAIVVTCPRWPRNLATPVFCCYVTIIEFHLKYLNITVNRHLEDTSVIVISSTVASCCQKHCFRPCITKDSMECYKYYLTVSTIFVCLSKFQNYNIWTKLQKIITTTFTGAATSVSWQMTHLHIEEHHIMFGYSDLINPYPANVDNMVSSYQC